MSKTLRPLHADAIEDFSQKLPNLILSNNSIEIANFFKRIALNVTPPIENTTPEAGIAGRVIWDASDEKLKVDTGSALEEIAIGASGVSVFTGLSDTPADYSGSAGKFLAVTSGADGVEFVDAPAGDNLGDHTATEDLKMAGFAITTNVTDGAAAVGHVLDTDNSLETEGSKILSIKNSGDEYFNIRYGDSFDGTAGSLFEFCGSNGEVMLQYNADPATNWATLMTKEGTDLLVIVNDDHTWTAGNYSELYLSPGSLGLSSGSHDTGKYAVVVVEPEYSAVQAHEGGSIGRLKMEVNSLDIQVNTSSTFAEPASSILLDLEKFKVSFDHGIDERKWEITTGVQGVDGLTMPRYVGGPSPLLNGQSIENYATKWIAYRKAEADVAAGDFLTELSIGINPESEDVIPKSVYFIPENSLTANDTDYATLNIYTRPTAGSPATLVATINTKTVGEGGTGDWSSFVPISIPLEAPTVNVSSLGTLTFSIAKEGSGVVVPAGTLQIEAHSELSFNSYGFVV